MNNLTERLLQLMDEKIKSHRQLEIPPKVFVELGGEMLEYVEGESLTARYPVEARFQNPLGYMQGGMIVAALDNTIGPLTYLLAPPSVTAQLNTSFLRPVSPRDKFITVRAWLTNGPVNSYSSPPKPITKRERSSLSVTQPI